MGWPLAIVWGMEGSALPRPREATIVLNEKAIPAGEDAAPGTAPRLGDALAPVVVCETARRGSVAEPAGDARVPTCSESWVARSTA